jgi:hypothetical protein
VELENSTLTASDRPFVPPHCPIDGCPSRHQQATFLWQRKGHYVRQCDRRVVQRFMCLLCRRYFSTQTFRLDYRLHRPTIHLALFDSFISKVTQRQAARNLECTRKTVVHRLSLLSEHSRAFHDRALENVIRRGGLSGDFQLDELESHENSRRLSPLTMPVLIEIHSYFVLHHEVATLPCRGKLKPRELEKKLERERREGRRRSQSRAAVERCFRKLAEVHAPGRVIMVSTDHKSTYPAVMRHVMPDSHHHVQHSSTAVRNYGNPLFPINHTLAMLRDGMSRLVRRSWGASKQRIWLDRHAWIWTAYRNYIRGITNRARFTTPAMALGVIAVGYTSGTLFEWRIFSDS